MLSDYEQDDFVSSCVEAIYDDEMGDVSTKTLAPTEYYDAQSVGAGSVEFLAAIQMLVEAQALVDSSLLPLYEHKNTLVAPTEVVEHLVFGTVYSRADSCRFYVPGYADAHKRVNDSRTWRNWVSFPCQSAYLYYLGAVAAYRSRFGETDVRIEWNDMTLLWLHMTHYLFDRGEDVRQFMIKEMEIARNTCDAYSRKLDDVNRVEAYIGSLVEAFQIAMHMTNAFCSGDGTKVVKYKVFSDIRESYADATDTPLNRLFMYLLDHGVFSIERGSRIVHKGVIRAKVFDMAAVYGALWPVRHDVPKDITPKYLEQLQSLATYSVMSLAVNLDMPFET